MKNSNMELALYCLVPFFIIVGSYLYGLKSCESRASLMGADYRFGIFERCMVKMDGRWTPMEAIRELK